MWPDLIARSKAAGLNTIETYTFWNLHERKRGVLDFSGRLDLRRFCDLAQAQGMHVILRVGPYICAETNYGGFPAWLRDVPGMQMRCWNAPFMREMERWIRTLADYIRPLCAPSGGPVILAEIENEYDALMPVYGEDGRRYMEWALELARSLGLGVPWLTCVPATGGLRAIHNSAVTSQLLADFRTAHPDQPMLWTEYWPGWYRTFGHPPTLRPASEIAFYLAVFFAAGGAGSNYYMWQGGTNFGREGMYLSPPEYGLDSPLDEYGLPTTKANHLARLHRILDEYAPVLLACDRPETDSPAPAVTAYRYRSSRATLAFLVNEDASNAATVETADGRFTLPPLSVSLFADGELRLNTAEVRREDEIARGLVPIAQPSLVFDSLPEPLPGAWPEAARSGNVVPQPIDQLLSTRDESDYCWYETEIELTAKQAGAGVLRLDRAADLVRVFVDGKHAGDSPTPLQEDRGRNDTDAFSQEIQLRLTPGRHTLSLLCCALGLIKHDVMIGMMNMAEEKKGLWGPVRWNGAPLPGPWRMQPMLLGEKACLPQDGDILAPWRPSAEGVGKPLQWFRASFRRPPGEGPFAVDLQGMNKGLIWVNSHCLGRYWLISGGDSGEPTQRYYHLPTSWLEERNTMIVLEEGAADPSAIRLCTCA